MQTSFLKTGRFFWICSVQYFIFEAVVQYGWNTSSEIISRYSMRYNYISDLGANTCLYFPNNSAMYVCSPLHALMNVSFLLSAIVAISGYVVLKPHFAFLIGKGKALANVGFLLIVVGCLGYLGVALFPENTNLPIHSTSAGILFTLTNIGLVVVGVGALRAKRMTSFAVFTLSMGILSLAALTILVTKTYPFLGVGLVERVVGYPLTIWFMFTGIFWNKFFRNKLT